MKKKEKKTKGQRGSQGQNRKMSEDFWYRNRQKAGVITLPSGLQYVPVAESSEGGCPRLEDTVVVDQRIKLVDGTVVRDTFLEREQDTFGVSETMEGLQEGLMLMREGARYRFFIPWELAWGKSGNGKKIGPYSMLIADVWLERVIPGR
ncbi:MAG: FKBP-type peptidyl-prolyl cis-trans isomerase [Deltaproteobacteria bacterium]|nr:FKBP-type peptidyl-prolyl cis-trans isomerase [Deltaproteobacteria bacterium]MBN2673365.1 FKBP-type peptidyl-prolyl cis-trans isomerase [Deltaproteobacteria bacterium]